MIPKFRVWSEEHQMMLFVWQLTRTDNCGMQVCADAFRGKEHVVIYDRPLDGRLKLMQSTGLFDKNGVEIFEGDIVNVCDEAIHLVFFNCGAFCIDFPSYGTPLHVYGSNQLEVIGNIHEHSELLEGRDGMD